MVGRLTQVRGFALEKDRLSGVLAFELWKIPDYAVDLLHRFRVSGRDPRQR